MDTCSICLRDIEDKHLIYTLSCNHKFHFNCFKGYIFKTKHVFFVDCPNCRQMNINVSYPFKDDFVKNLKAICSQSVGKIRCPCTTTKGLKCKKKSHLLNYGLFQFHNKDILPKDKYEPMFKYIYHSLQCSNRCWETKIYLIDFVKKLLIKFKNEINTIEDIYKYLFIYIADAKKNKITNCYKDKSILYSYYGFELPSYDWVSSCVEKRCLF